MKGLARDTLGELLELGKSTAKTTVKQIGQTFSPLKLTEKVLGLDNDDETNLPDEKKLKKNFTPLDTERLEKEYKKPDEIKYKELRKRLFDQIKNEERQIFEQKKEEEKKKLLEEERKRKEEEEKRKKEQEELTIPQGKIRRSIFAPIKKTIQQLIPEFRGSKSKG